MNTDQQDQKVATIELFIKRSRALSPLIFSFFVGLFLIIGWRLKKYELIASDRGLGYLLGIVGTVLMIALFIYPLRKRLRQLQIIGSIKRWFQVHMILGVLGPVCILFHANFKLGSLNSNVALFSMLIVAISGILGRYIYNQIHYGLYGQRTHLIELRNEFEQQKEILKHKLSLIPGIKEGLFSFTDQVLTPTTDFKQSAQRWLMTSWRSRMLLRQIRQKAEKYLIEYGSTHHWNSRRTRKMTVWVHREIKYFLSQSTKVAQFNFFERLFSFWHVMHIPLALILAISVIVHVIAVNFY